MNAAALIEEKEGSERNGTYLSPVIPAKAGIQRLCLFKKARSHWIPAYAGMTRIWMPALK